MAYPITETTTRQQAEGKRVDRCPVDGFAYEAVILAGGRGSRMGGADKGLVVWRDKPLVDHLIDRLRGQTVAPRRILISANRNLDEYRRRATVVTDAEPGFDGPLRGIQAALRVCHTSRLLVVPCDTPRLPLVLAERLYRQGAGHAAFASADGHQQPLCCLLRRCDLAALDAFLDTGQRKVRSFMSKIKAVEVNFEDEGDDLGVDAGGESSFMNFNSPEMLS
ncbi:molybdenum cofactor guanylyltransferase MobA [Orrella marina]|uniref:Molybdenum cofactor guanylyltransferase n=1 Tax=Orrella marina TaxID=2163011 RepID=A0A2R4XNE2_9BURK|nr:molybdenum cofactor guanylyltransferase MobA [Orrella marina]AWB35229.1 molybdenum cofactor guanylyltransferase [Orrella marina]